MRVVRSLTAPIKGRGKPDYTREVSSGRERPGITLKTSQTLKVFAHAFTTMLSPYSIVTAPLPPNGTHTEVASLTVMTDAAAQFMPPVPPMPPVPSLARGLVGMTIQNVTDGSSGVIIDNTVNTVTVAALTGGVTNRWNTNDVYTIIAHLIDAATGLSMPYSVDVGYTLTAVSGSYSFTEDATVWGYIDGFVLAGLGVPIAGTPFYEAQVVGLATTLLDPTAATAHTFDITITNRGLGAIIGSSFFVVLVEAIGTAPLPNTKTVKCKFCGHQWTVPRATSGVKCPKCRELNVYFDLSKFRGTP